MTYLENGTILFMPDFHGKARYWKTTGHHSFVGSSSYQVVACSKTGKEFKDRNGFAIDFLHKEIEKKDGKIQLVGNTAVGVKANTDKGISSTRRKNRIRFLKARIEKDTDELAKLEAVEASPCPYDGKKYKDVPGYVDGHGCPICKAISGSHIPIGHIEQAARGRDE